MTKEMYEQHRILNEEEIRSKRFIMKIALMQIVVYLHLIVSICFIPIGNYFEKHPYVNYCYLGCCSIAVLCIIYIWTSKKTNII